MTKLAHWLPIGLIFVLGAGGVWLLAQARDRPCRGTAPGSITEMSCERSPAIAVGQRLPGE